MSQARILVIDGEAGTLSVVAPALKAHGFSVDCAHGSRRALEVAQNDRYELDVLDLVVPGGGIETLKAIVALRPVQRVLVLCASSDVTLKVRCLELGAIDYLSKPFALAELLARVRTQVRAALPPVEKDPAVAVDERFVRVGQVTLDLERHVAETADGPVGLSRREFALLLHMMRRPGRVCSREQLLAEVWNCPFDPGTNVVDVYIRRLRSKLGTETIETLRSVGYSLPAA